MLAAQLLILSSLQAFGGDQPASCELASGSIVSHSASGLAQVSNVGDIQIQCRVPARLYSSRPDGGLEMLKVVTVTSEVSTDGGKKPVPSEVNATGGRSDGESETEWVLFHFHLPLEPAERDAEADRFLAKIEKSLPPGQFTEEDHQRAQKRARDLVYQHRVGHFRVECHILDGDREIGVGVVELEVLFKGRFSDLGLPGFSPA